MEAGRGSRQRACRLSGRPLPLPTPLAVMLVYGGHFLTHALKLEVRIYGIPLLRFKYAAGEQSGVGRGGAETGPGRVVVVVFVVVIVVVESLEAKTESMLESLRRVVCRMDFRSTYVLMSVG